jgi:hypothetical protein
VLTNPDKPNPDHWDEGVLEIIGTAVHAAHEDCWMTAGKGARHTAAYVLQALENAGYRIEHERGVWRACTL